MRLTDGPLCPKGTVEIIEPDIRVMKTMATNPESIKFGKTETVINILLV